MQLEMKSPLQGQLYGEATMDCGSGAGEPGVGEAGLERGGR